jgi:hypothetical protein
MTNGLMAAFYEHLPRVGDTMRFDDNSYGKVTEVIWCMDEPRANGQRVNLRVESIDAAMKEPTT